MNRIVCGSLPVAYTIEATPNLLSPENSTLASLGDSKRRLVVIDRGICQWYLEPVEMYFKSVGIDAHIVIIDTNEDCKDLEHVLELIREFEAFGLLRRSEPVIAIGGGVLLDVVGFACSIYRRGVPYIRVPTTLVGLIDACVGIKTGINFEGRRNRLGSYYPPLVSFLDKSFLKTLDPLQISSGLGEVLKIGLILDKELFFLLEAFGCGLVKKKLDMPVGDVIIEKAIHGMCNELEPNLWESNLKRLVDFGHSFSPIIEMRSLQTPEPLTHGQAVTLDMIFSSILASQRGLSDLSLLQRLLNVVDSLELPISHPLFYEPTLLLESLNDTMKHRNGNQHLPVPTEIGKGSFMENITYSEIQSGVEIWKGSMLKFITRKDQ